MKKIIILFFLLFLIGCKKKIDLIYTGRVINKDIVQESGLLAEVLHYISIETETNHYLILDKEMYYFVETDDIVEFTIYSKSIHGHYFVKEWRKL